MKISERTVKRLGEIITGDKGISPYRGGPKLVSFFNECGTNHTYGQGFPSRWMFAEECIRQFNDTPTMKKVILSAVDPRDFMGTTVYDKETKQEKPANLQDAVTYLNEFLAFDGYEIVPHGKGYDVVDKTRGEIVVDVKLEPSHLSHAFIMEQIEKCRTKMSHGDYDGAITNGRSLVEAVLAAIEKEFDPNAPDYDGDLPKLYKRVQKQRRLTEILDAIDLLFHQVWYNRHQITRQKIERGQTKIVEKETFPVKNHLRRPIQRNVWEGALKAAAKVEKKYGVENLGPWDDFDWGMINGKRSALPSSR